MTKQDILKRAASIANQLDSIGLHREASEMDNKIIKKIAQNQIVMGPPEGEEADMYFDKTKGKMVPRYPSYTEGYKGPALPSFEQFMSNVQSGAPADQVPQQNQVTPEMQQSAINDQRMVDSQGMYQFKDMQDGPEKDKAIQDYLNTIYNPQAAKYNPNVAKQLQKSRMNTLPSNAPAPAQSTTPSNSSLSWLGGKLNTNKPSGIASGIKNINMSPAQNVSNAIQQKPSQPVTQNKPAPKAQVSNRYTGTKYPEWQNSDSSWSSRNNNPNA